jgi:hypothetical protein
MRRRTGPRDRNDVPAAYKERDRRWVVPVPFGDADRPERHLAGIVGWRTKPAGRSSIVTNTVERLAHPWIEGALHIVSAFAGRGAPSESVTDWTGRWWNVWNPVDLVPVGDRVLAASPAQLNPLSDAAEIEVTGSDQGRIVLATGLASHGETARRKRGPGGAVEEVWLGGVRLVPEAQMAAELEARYARPRDGGPR